MLRTGIGPREDIPIDEILLQSQKSQQPKFCRLLLFLLRVLVPGVELVAIGGISAAVHV
jgi:hypothetical protein